MKKKQRKIMYEDGEIMLEAILVVIPTLFVMIFLLSLGFLLYQKWNIQYIADEVASKVAARYEYVDEELPEGEIHLKDAQKTVLYKYLFHADDFEKKSRAKAEKYGKLLSQKIGYGIGTGDEIIELQVEEDSLARRHIRVTITGTYRIPFSEGLEIFGIEGTRVYTAISYAECVDVSDYMNTVVFADRAGEILIDNDSKILGMINTWINVFSKLFE